jgi:hypothetical protein
MAEFSSASADTSGLQDFLFGMSQDTGKARFFRQSGWMVLATLMAGICMFLIHPLYGPMLGDVEYGLYGTLLALINVMGIPSMGLQTTFAQQTAAAVTPEDRARLAGTARAVLLWGVGLWLLVVAVVVVFQKDILATLSITDPLALWLVVLLSLTALAQPVFFGVLQGQQNFLWLGWAQVANGVGRLVFIGLIVGLLGTRSATGAIGGAVIGALIAFLVGAVFSRSAWLTSHRAPGKWDNWVTDVIPLTLALGAFQFLFSIDMILVRSMLGEHQTGYYSAAGTFARGLISFTAPLAGVMFPKVVHSVSTGNRTNVLTLTLAISFGLAVLGAATCTGIGFGLQYLAQHAQEWAPKLPGGLALKLTNSPEAFLVMGQLLPWFVWAMVPLVLANVLLNNLLARKQYRVVPYLVLVVGLYAAVAMYQGENLTFVLMIQLLGLFNLLFFATMAGFTWFGQKKLAEAV